jgi:hypothetical protein
MVVAVPPRAPRATLCPRRLQQHHPITLITAAQSIEQQPTLVATMPLLSRLHVRRAQNGPMGAVSLLRLSERVVVARTSVTSR